MLGMRVGACFKVDIHIYTNALENSLGNDLSAMADALAFEYLRF